MGHTAPTRLPALCPPIMKGTFVHPNRTRSLTVAAIGGTVLAVTMLGLPSQAATSGGSTRARHGAPRGGESTVRTPGNFDVRQLSGTPLVKASRAEVNGRTKADNAYFRSLGGRAVVDIDPLTHTPRDFGRLDGFLSGPSSALGPHGRAELRPRPPRRSRPHLGRPRRPSASARTTSTPSASTTCPGPSRSTAPPSSATACRCSVTRDGRVLAVQGSPVSGLAKLASAAPSGIRMSATAARSASAHDVGGTVAQASVASSKAGSSASTVWSNHDYAKRVWFLTAAGSASGLVDLRPDLRRRLPARRRRRHRPGALPPLELRQRHRRRARLRQLPGCPQGWQAAGGQPGQAGLHQEERQLPPGFARSSPGTT